MKKIFYLGAIVLSTLNVFSQPTAGLVAYWRMNGTFF